MHLSGGPLVTTRRWPAIAGKNITRGDELAFWKKYLVEKMFATDPAYFTFEIEKRGYIREELFLQILVLVDLA